MEETQRGSVRRNVTSGSIVSVGEKNVARDSNSHNRGLKKMLVADVKKAFFNASVRRKVFSELPSEEVIRSLYGAQDAPVN